MIDSKVDLKFPFIFSTKIWLSVCKAEATVIQYLYFNFLCLSVVKI